MSLLAPFGLRLAIKPLAGARGSVPASTDWQDGMPGNFPPESARSEESTDGNS